MAMQRKLWSINGLSAELGMARRTLSKRLEGLPPAEVKRYGSRTEKRWYLADVMEYLRNPTPARDLEPYIEEFRQMVGKMLYPGILSTKAFGAIIINLCHEELGIEKAQGLRIYQLVALALCYAFSELLEDDDMTFALPDHIEEMAKLGPEAYLEKLADSQ